MTVGAKVFRFLGTTEEVTTCDLCGRKDLKNTVALEPFEGGEIVYYGSDCAARAIGWTQREIVKAAQAADTLRREAARREWEARYNAHPLKQQITREREAYKAAHGGFLAGALASGDIARWNELGKQVIADVGECPRDVPLQAARP
jgi:hypothetical protein